MSVFKAYDIRGKVGSELTEELAYRFGRSFAIVTNCRKVAIGRDNRCSSAALQNAIIKGLNDEGVNAVNIGMCGTELVYFAAQTLDVQGGIQVTASHNPISYNGIKFVGEGAKPITALEGYQKIRELTLSSGFSDVKLGCVENSKTNLSSSYAKYLCSYVSLDNITPLKIVVNAGNGTVGELVDAIEAEFSRAQVPITFIKLNHEPDSSFPKGIPNPLIVENRKETQKAVVKHKADLGIAWDGDHDRCFLFDQNGQFVEGYYIVGLLAQTFCEKQKGQIIVHDPRLYWNTKDVVEGLGSTTVASKTGHALVKQKMREVDAVYGGEMSAHHYFRDFAYCDSGMIPWLLLIELMSRTGSKLSDLVKERQKLFPCSGEINFSVKSADNTLLEVKNHFIGSCVSVSEFDGIDMQFDKWRFNLRGSNTEPLVRLNVESRGDKKLMEQKTSEVISVIENSK